MKRTLFLKLLLCGAMIFSCAAPLFAATDSDKNESAGAQQSYFQQEQQFRARVLQRKIEERAKVEIEAPEKAEGLKEGKAFKLTGVMLTGNNSIPSEVFTPLIKNISAKKFT